MKGKWKQNSKKKKGNAVLQKYMVAVDDFIKSKSGAEEVEGDRGLRFVKRKSRKELRKEKRKMKKAKMKSHYEGKKTLSLPLDGGENEGDEKQPQQLKKKMEKGKKEVPKANSSKSTSGPAEKQDNSKTPSSSKKGKKINKLQESRKIALLEANEDEDREIKKLERRLGLNKRKNKKSLPQSFVADGLDYILGMLDSGSSAAGMYDDDDDDMDVAKAKENFEKLDENDSQLSDEEPGDEMSSDGSDKDMGSFDGEEDEDEEEEEQEDEEEDDDDDAEMVDEEEMEDELDESDAADSEDENVGEPEDEADTPGSKTSISKSETVSSERFVYY